MSTAGQHFIQDLEREIEASTGGQHVNNDSIHSVVPVSLIQVPSSNFNEDEAIILNNDFDDDGYGICIVDVKSEQVNEDFNVNAKCEQEDNYYVENIKSEQIEADVEPSDEEPDEERGDSGMNLKHHIDNLIVNAISEEGDDRMLCPKCGISYTDEELSRAKSLGENSLEDVHVCVDNLILNAISEDGDDRMLCPKCGLSYTDDELSRAKSLGESGVEDVHVCVTEEEEESDKLTSTLETCDSVSTGDTILTNSNVVGMSSYGNCTTPAPSTPDCEIRISSYGTCENTDDTALTDSNTGSNIRISSYGSCDSVGNNVTASTNSNTGSEIRISSYGTCENTKTNDAIMTDSNAGSDIRISSYGSCEFIMTCSDENNDDARSESDRIGNLTEICIQETEGNTSTCSHKTGANGLTCVNCDDSTGLQDVDNTSICSDATGDLEACSHSVDGSIGGDNITRSLNLTSANSARTSLDGSDDNIHKTCSRGSNDSLARSVYTNDGVLRCSQNGNSSNSAHNAGEILITPSQGMFESAKTGSKEDDDIAANNLHAACDSVERTNSRRVTDICIDPLAEVLGSSEEQSDSEDVSPTYRGFDSQGSNSVIEINESDSDDGVPSVISGSGQSTLKQSENYSDDELPIMKRKRKIQSTRENSRTQAIELHPGSSAENSSDSDCDSGNGNYSEIGLLFNVLLEAVPNISADYNVGRDKILKEATRFIQHLEKRSSELIKQKLMEQIKSNQLKFKISSIQSGNNYCADSNVVDLT